MVVAIYTPSTEHSCDSTVLYMEFNVAIVTIVEPLTWPRSRENTLKDGMFVDLC